MEPRLLREVGDSWPGVGSTWDKPGTACNARKQGSAPKQTYPSIHGPVLKEQKDQLKELPLSKGGAVSKGWNIWNGNRL